MLTEADIDALVGELKGLRKRLDVVERINVDLQLRLADLAGRSLDWRGTWEGRPFPRGAVTTWNGSTWFAERETRAQDRPGADDPQSPWRLLAKRGAECRCGCRHPKGSPNADA